MAEQLIKKTEEGHSNVMPKSWIEAITDKSTGESLTHILQGFNMYFLSYTGNTEQTRCQVPKILRKKGLWVTYVKYDGNVYTEWYNSNNIDDKSWGNSSNWRIGNNELVGDLTISANGNWVINGNETEFKAIGEKGNTPLIRIANNKLQVSYDTGNTYHNVSDNPVYTQIRTYNNKLQISTDLGANWTDASDEIAAYFRFNSGQGNNVGNIQISRNNKDWSNLSGNFVNNLHISKYIGADETLPTSGVAEGTIYAKGPTYAESDTSHSNPIYRLWVYAYKGNTLAWQDNGEFTSISAGVVQELGDSENLVVSQKCVSQEIIQGGVYDVSTHNNDAVFESLQALLSSSNLSTLIPPSVRHGGMSIRFIHGSVPSSDNKYVQYRLMAQNFTTDVTQWRGVDNAPTAGSKNLVESGGVADTVYHIKAEIGFSETITLTTDNRVALGITGTVVSATASQSWCGLVIHLQTGVTYDFGELYDSSTNKGWQSIGICARYPQIGDSVTVLTGTQARNFIPTDEQEYALIYIRVVSLPYECTLYAAGIKKDMEDIETDLSDFKDDTSGKLVSIENTIGEPAVIKVVTSSDYANKIWGGKSGVIASNSSINGYIVHLIKGRKYIINGTILSCQLFTHVPTIGDIDTQGSISPNVDYTPTQDYYGLITFKVEQTISVKKYAYGLFNIAEDIKEETEKNSEDINRGYSSVYYANMIWGGSSTGIIASTSSQNGFIIHIPSGQTELYLDNISSLTSVVAFTHVLAIGNTDNIGGEKFIKSGKQIKCTFPSNANGLWVLFTVRVAEVDITSVTYSLSNFVYDAVKSGLKGKNILCLGDSITEFVQSDGNNYPKYLSLLSGATVYGCGVGGTRLSQRAKIDPTTIGGSYAALDIVSLTDDIASGDFTTAIAAAEYLKDHASDDNTAQINVLSNIDFDTLDWIIVMGGTNDWTSDAPIGQDTDEGDYTTIKGSLRKIVRNLCTRCPNARILLMTEPPRYFQERNRSHFCDVWENGQGNTLTDVINAIIGSAGFSHVPIVDLYRKLGWNEFNWDTYYKYQATGIIDLTHPYSGLRYIAEMAMKYIRNCYY